MPRPVHAPFNDRSQWEKNGAYRPISGPASDPLMASKPACVNSFHPLQVFATLPDIRDAQSGSRLITARTALADARFERALRHLRRAGAMTSATAAGLVIDASPHLIPAKLRSRIRRWARAVRAEAMAVLIHAHASNAVAS